MQNEDSLFELILISIGKRTSLSQSLSDNDWRIIYTEVEKQSLIGVLYSSIEILPAIQRPPLDILMEWIGQTEKIKVQNKIVNKRTAEISHLFQKGGYRSTVLKGQGAALLYPYPEYRQSGDIDLWVDAPRYKVVNFCKTHWGIDHADYKNVVITNFPDVYVEVHFIPSWFYCLHTERRFRKWYRELWDEQFTNDTGKGFCAPTVRFNLVYSMVHIYKHLFDEGIGLRQLMDFYYILMHSTVDERKEALGYLKDFKMARFASAVMYVMKEVFAIDDEYLLCEPSQKYGKKLLADIIEGGNFGHFNAKNAHGKENRITHGIRNIRHNASLLFDYPSEVIWSPLWKCWHWWWRKKQGYL